MMPVCPGLDYVVVDFVGGIAAEVVHDPSQQVGPVGKGVDRIAAPFLVQGEGRQQPRHPEAMVAVEVRYEDVAEA